MKQSVSLALAMVAGVLLSCGCASTPKRDLTRLQGSWVGEELGGPQGECRLSIEGHTMKFQGARQQEWYVGNLTLDPKTRPKQANIVIADCGFRQYVNKTSKAIYKLENDKLTIAGHEPGNPAVPTVFNHDEASRTRAFVFTRQ